MLSMAEAPCCKLTPTSMEPGATPGIATQKGIYMYTSPTPTRRRAMPLSQPRYAIKVVHSRHHTINTVATRIRCAGLQLLHSLTLLSLSFACPCASAMYRNRAFPCNRLGRGESANATVA